VVWENYQKKSFSADGPRSEIADSQRDDNMCYSCLPCRTLLESEQTTEIGKEEWSYQNDSREGKISACSNYRHFKKKEKFPTWNGSGRKL